LESECPRRLKTALRTHTLRPQSALLGTWLAPLLSHASVAASVSCHALSLAAAVRSTLQPC
jgi:hypothetical protein